MGRTLEKALCPQVRMSKKKSTSLGGAGFVPGGPSPDPGEGPRAGTEALCPPSLTGRRHWGYVGCAWHMVGPGWAPEIGIMGLLVSPWGEYAPIFPKPKDSGLFTFLDYDFSRGRSPLRGPGPTLASKCYVSMETNAPPDAEKGRGCRSPQ